MKCRACLKFAAEYIDLGTQLLPNKTYLDCFNLCTLLNATLTDELPNVICCSCAQKLEIINDFVETARNSDFHLRNIKNDCDKPKVVEVLSSPSEAFVADIENMEIVVIEPIDEEMMEQRLQNEYEYCSENDEDYVESIEQKHIKNGSYWHCLKCKRLLSNDISYEGHMNLHKNLCPFKCVTCSKSFRCSKTLERHTVLKHNDKQFSFELQPTTSPEFVALLSCEHCQKLFESTVLLEIHVIIEHNFIFKASCPLCSKQINAKNPDEFLKHLYSEHPVEYTKLVDDVKSIVTSSSDLIEQYEIDDNEKKLIRLNRTTDEMSIVEECKFCKKQLLRRNMAKHLAIHTKRDRKLLCSFCPRYFKNQKSLRQHEKTHCEESEGAVYICADCDRQYSSISILEQHRKNAHKERDHICAICGNAFKLKSQLINHMKLHLEKNIQCPHCDKKYARQFDLNVHLRSHTGELPYECHLCEKRFAIKVRLTYHLQKHNGVKHTCRECGAQFNSKQKLKAHSFKHSGMPYRCKLCDDHGFPNRDVFKRHLLRVHHATISEEALVEMFQRYTGKTTRICEIQALSEDTEKIVQGDWSIQTKD